MQRLTSSKQGALGDDLGIYGQGEVIARMLLEALDEAVKLAGDEQQLERVELELNDSIGFHGGSNMTAFELTVVTRLR